jgi:hypothetical protein
MSDSHAPKSDAFFLKTYSVLVTALLAINVAFSWRRRARPPATANYSRAEEEVSETSALLASKTVRSPTITPLVDELKYGSVI